VSSVANFARNGFRVVISRPTFVLAEIAWRWAFGAAAGTLVFLALRRIFLRADVGEIESLLARHSDLFLIADACARLLSQVLPQLAAEALVLVPAIALLWIVAATVGRIFTLNALVNRIGASASRAYVRVLMLHIIRAALALAALLAAFGAVRLVGATLALNHMAAALALSLVLVLVVLTCWSAVNWFVALAPIWMMREGRGVFASIGDSLDLYRRNASGYVGIASLFGLIRVVAILVATIAALIAAQLSPASAIAAGIALGLGYFAVADFLYIARLAAYVALDDSSQQSALSIQSKLDGLLPDSAASLLD